MSKMNMMAKRGEWTRDVIMSSIGMWSASFFSIAYYATPLYILVTAALVLRASIILVAFGESTTSLINPDVYWPVVMSVPIVISALTKPRVFPELFHTFPMRCVMKYFNYKEYLEVDDDDLMYHINHVKPGEYLFST